MIEVAEMVAVIGSCRREMQAMLPADEFASLSSKTRQEYRKLGRTLLNRVRYADLRSDRDVVPSVSSHQGVIR